MVSNQGLLLVKILTSKNIYPQISLIIDMILRVGIFVSLILFTIIPSNGLNENNYGSINRNDNGTLLPKNTMENENFTSYIYPEDVSLTSFFGDVDSNSVVDFLMVKNKYSEFNNHIYNRSIDGFDIETIKCNSFNKSSNGWIIPSQLQDLDGDNRVDVLRDYNLYTWENRTFIEKDVLSSHDCYKPFMGDVDCDGDLDMLSDGGRKGPIFLENRGNGSFGYYDDFRGGIPDFQYSDEPHLNIGSYTLHDINLDGYLDICSTASDKKLQTEDWEFVWLSNGKGNWTLASDGLPFDDYSYRRSIEGDPSGIISVEDFDNDGDYDQIVNLAKRGTVFFENNLPEPWNVIPLEKKRVHNNYEFFVSDLRTCDFNSDGLVDVVQLFQGKGVPNGEDKTMCVIFWNRGNFTFDSEMIGVFSGSHPNLIPPIDIDLDGSLDILFDLCIVDGLGRILHIYPIVVINNYELENEMFIRDLPFGDLVRGGMYFKVEWSSANMYDMLVNNTFFNLSISYNGKDGFYHPIKTDYERWWSYVKIPDFPTNNAYLKVETGDLQTVYGPITIISKNDTKYLVDVRTDDNRTSISTEDDLNITLTPSPRINSPVDVDLKMIHSNGSLDLGNHRIFPNSNTNFTWDPPDDLFELDCRFSVEMPFIGEDFIITTDETYNLLNDSFYLDDIIVYGPDIVGRGDNVTVEISSYSRTGLNLSHSLEYTLKDVKGSIDVDPIGNGYFSIYGKEICDANFIVAYDCFGVVNVITVNISVEKSISDIEFMSNKTDIRTGELVDITISTLDMCGDPVGIRFDEINWTVSGPAVVTYLSSYHCYLNIISNGVVNVTVTLDFSTGSYRESYEFISNPMIENIILEGIGSEFHVGYPIRITLRALDKGEHLVDVNVNWSSDGPVDIIQQKNRSLIVKPLEDEIFILKLKVSYFEESHQEEYQIDPDTGLLDIKMNITEFAIPTNRMTECEIILMGSDNNSYKGTHELEVFSEDDDILRIYDYYGLNLFGRRSGTTNLTVKVQTDYVVMTKNFTFMVFDPIVNISYSGYLDVSRNCPVTFSLLITDTRGKTVEDADIFLSIDNGIIHKDTTGYVFIIDEIGKSNLLVKAERFGQSFQRTIAIKCSFRAISFEVSEIPEGIRVGEHLELDTFLILEDDKRFPVCDLLIESDPGLSVENSGDKIYLEIMEEGCHWINLTARYLNQELYRSLEFNSLNSSKLFSIELTTGSIDDQFLFKVRAYDQYGNDITHLCDIEWIGDVENRNGNTTVGSGKITVRVSYDDKILEDSIVLENDESNGIDPLLVAIPVLIVIIIGIAVFLFIRKPFGKSSKEEIPEKSE